MALAGRKRPDVEVIVEEAPPRKILRLKQNDDGKTDISQLDASDIGNLHILSKLERRLNYQEDIEELLISLIDKLKSTKTAMIRSRIAQLLSRIISVREVDCSFITNEVIQCLLSTESHLFSSELLSLSTSLVPHIKTHNQQISQLLNIAKERLNSRASSVRSAAIVLTAAVIKHGKLAGIPFEELLGMQLLVIDFIKDPEPRVRSAAIEVLSQLHECGTSLESSVYDHVSQALNDDYDRVRMAALRLVAAVSLSTPDRTVPVKPGSPQTVRMLDDGFMKVCDSINDISFLIRTEAAKLMGKFSGVGLDFLEQTLDKKLMSNMRRKQSAHERQKEFYMSGEWSSGKRFADDAPKELVAEESVSLINMGACGAYVHALEDEFMEVREAAIDSLTVLAQSNPSFARQTQDFLVDMFNDEIEEVRLKAILSLCRIAQHLCLRDDQVEIITGVLKDFGGDIRVSMHKLIRLCKISTQNGLRDIILSLLENLRKFPQDRLSIFKTMKEVGLRHPGLISPLLSELLSLDFYFDMPEPNMDDDCYVAVMIAVYNAASLEDNLYSVFPEHTKRHYRFHRSSFPRLIPSLTQLEKGVTLYNDSSDNLTESDLQNVSSVIQLLLHMDENSQNVANRRQILRLCQRDLKKWSKLSADKCPQAHFLSDYITCLLLFFKIEDYLESGSDKHVLSLSQKIVHVCEKLINLYNNVPQSTVENIRQFQLISLSLGLVRRISNNSAQADEYKLYLEQLSMIKSQIKSKGEDLAFMDRILEIEEALQAGNWSLLQTVLSHLVLSRLHVPHEPMQSVTMVSCELEEPKTRSDNPKRFTAGLALCLPVRAVLRDINKSADLFVKVSLPDNSSVIKPIKKSELTEDTGEIILNSQVVFSHGHWSEGSYVEVCILVRSEGIYSYTEICPPNRVYIVTKLEKKAHSGNLL